MEDTTFTLAMTAKTHRLSDVVLITHYAILGGLGHYTKMTSDAATETVLCKVDCREKPYDLMFCVSYQLIGHDVKHNGFDVFEYEIKWEQQTPPDGFKEELNSLKAGLVALLCGDENSIMYQEDDDEPDVYPEDDTSEWRAVKRVMDYLHNDPHNMLDVSYLCPVCEKTHGLRLPPGTGDEDKLCPKCARVEALIEYNEGRL